MTHCIAATTLLLFQLQCSKTRCSVWFVALYLRCLKNRGEGCVLWQRVFFFILLRLQCVVLRNREDLKGWLAAEQPEKA